MEAMSAARVLNVRAITGIIALDRQTS